MGLHGRYCTQQWCAHFEDRRDAGPCAYLLALSSMASIGEVVREIKAGSSKWFRESHHRLFAWQEGFGAFSVSASNLRAVIRYIENQEEHHRKISFLDEWRTFVEKHSRMASEFGLVDMPDKRVQSSREKRGTHWLAGLPGVSLRASSTRAANCAALHRIPLVFRSRS
jgi:hypothetical protein